MNARDSHVSYYIISFTCLIPKTFNITKWNHFTNLTKHRCRTLNARCSCLEFNAREIRDETTIKSKERGIEELKKLRKVNEKLLQFPISRTNKRVICFACYLQGDIETGLTANRSESLLNVALNFNIITYMCKSLLNAKLLNIKCLLYNYRLK